MKFAAVQLLRARAGRAHAEAAPARVAAAGAARRGAAAAGAGLRASVLRQPARRAARRASRSSRSTRRCSLSAPGRFERAKQLARDADRARARRRSGRRRDFRRCGRDRGHAVGGSRAGGGGRRRRARRVRRDAVPRGAVRRAQSCSTAGTRTIVVVTDLQESGWDAGDRAVGAGSGRTIEVADVGAPPPNLAVTARRGRWPIGSSRRFATPARERARRARAPHDRRSARRRRRRCRSARISPPTSTLPARRAARPAVGAVDDADGVAGRQHALCRARRHEPAVGAGRDRVGRSRPRRVLRAARAAPPARRRRRVIR